VGKQKNHDEYIEAAAPFAQPILKRIRAAFHKACPQVEETMKWSFPHFEYKGVLASMAAFKEHCRFGFWKGAIMKTVDASDLMGNTSMSYEKITSLKELPPDIELIKMIKEAVELNEKGIKAPSQMGGKKSPAQPLDQPDDLTAALKKNKAASKTWADFSQSAKNEYIDWVAGAKQQATRESRLKQAIEWISSGKPRNWKYMKEWN
jgi:uncharacterized protein YdeI (YjbR/CyaY-like superfamily)